MPWVPPHSVWGLPQRPTARTCHGSERRLCEARSRGWAPDTTAGPVPTTFRSPGYPHTPRGVCLTVPRLERATAPSEGSAKREAVVGHPTERPSPAPHQTRPTEPTIVAGRWGAQAEGPAHENRPNRSPPGRADLNPTASRPISPAPPRPHPLARPTHGDSQSLDPVPRNAEPTSRTDSPRPARATRRAILKALCWRGQRGIPEAEADVPGPPAGAEPDRAAVGVSAEPLLGEPGLRRLHAPARRRRGGLATTHARHAQVGLCLPKPRARDSGVIRIRAGRLRALPGPLPIHAPNAHETQWGPVLLGNRGYGSSGRPVRLHCRVLFGGSSQYGRRTRDVILQKYLAFPTGSDC